MCGIIAYKGDEQAETLLQQGLKRLDYRGYDSWGIATEEGTHKQVGQVTDEDLGLQGTTGIAHTRWATHGGVTQANAHPHESCEDTLCVSCGTTKCDDPFGETEELRRFAIVHNGIIENYEELKTKIGPDHNYTSETDSEVIAHYLEQGDNIINALKNFRGNAKGSYAVVVLDRETGKLYAIRNKSPLLLAKTEDGYFFASDIYAVSKWTTQAYFMEDGDIIEIGESSLLNPSEDMSEEIRWEDVEWTEEEAELHDNNHWMEKEIREIPLRIEDLHEKVYGDGQEYTDEFEDFVEHLEDSERVIFTASGTSYHATLIGAHYLQRAGVEAQTLIASEFENYERVTEDTTVIAVSQSGETRDVLNAIEHSKEKGADVVSITNVPHSTIERETDANFRIQAKQENCVAATKTFTNQLGVMLALGEKLGADVMLDGMNQPLKKMLWDEEWEAMHDAGIINGKLKERKDDFYIIGSGITYPIARETALKLKEIGYIHAEGMMAGEFKHGTLALIEEDTPVLALNDGSIDSNISEVESRGAHVLEKKWCWNTKEGKYPSDYETEEVYLMRSVVYGFFLTYYLAKFRGLPIDKPRNLAKSVTVK